MKTILTIGHTDLLLPASANVNVILKALAAAQLVDDKYDSNTHDYVYHVKPGQPRINVKVVSEKQVIDASKRKQIPARASEDCHGDQGI